MCVAKFKALQHILTCCISFYLWADVVSSSWQYHCPCWGFGAIYLVKMLLHMYWLSILLHHPLQNCAQSYRYFLCFIFAVILCLFLMIYVVACKMLLWSAFIFALAALKASEPRTFSEDIIVSKMSAVTMVTGRLTVPCDSLSNLYSHVQLCDSPRTVLCATWLLILQYTVIAMQQNILSFLLSKVFYFCNGEELFNQCFTLLKKYA